MRILQFFGLWVLPFLVTSLLLLTGFAYWCFASEPGTRWLLRTATTQVDGTVHGVHGTLRDGLYVQGLSLPLPGADVRVVGLHFKALWPELLERRLHVNDLSAVRVDVALHPAPGEDAPSAEPFQMPALPIDIQLDRLALGGLGLLIDGVAPPVELLSVSTALSVHRHGALLRLDHLQAAWDRMLISVDGRLALNGLASPWPLVLDLQGFAQDRSEGSPLCLREYLGLPHLVSAAAPGPGSQSPSEAVAPCRIDMNLRASGSLDSLNVVLGASGEGLALDAVADVFPNQAFPLERAHVSGRLPDGSGISLRIAPQADSAPTPVGGRALAVQLELRRLDVQPWLPEGIGDSRLTMQAEAGVVLDGAHALQALSLALAFDPASRWNGQALSGTFSVGRLGMLSGPLLGPQGTSPDPTALVLSGLDADLALGPNRLRAQGEIAAGRTDLDLDAQAPDLAAIWPGLPGGAALHALLQGSLAQQQLALEAAYTPANAQEGVLGQAPVKGQLRLDGAWVNSKGWQGTLEQLEVSHADLFVRSEVPVPLALQVPDADAWGWTVGAARLAIGLSDEVLLRVDHDASSGAGHHWSTKGHVDPMIVTPARIEQFQRWLARGQVDEGGVHTELSAQASGSRLEARLDWSLSYSDTLTGDIRLARTDGDLVVPLDVPIELALRQMSLDVAIRRRAAGLSQIEADLQVATERMGSMRVRAGSPLHATPGGGLGVRPQDTKTVHFEAVSEDLAWVNLFLDGSIEVGGTIHADIQGRSRPDGRWTFNGPLQGEGISVLSVDQGVRLLEGTLAAHFEGEHIRLDSLRFPAVRRVTPKEWRTATWISEEPDAQDGALTLVGDWNLFDPGGGLDIQFHRYPILQRSDRYAMISGAIRIDSVLPRLQIRGGVQADAGWFDLDMLSNIPSLDGDVVILTPGQTAPPEDTPSPLDVDLDLNVDLGPRFYLTGYGVNAGLVGNLNLRMIGGKLTALGELRTRGGSLDAYGQHLQLRGGTVTFQGDITNPVIGIEALRTDAAVRAGVRVSGTARRPRIDLVSYPDVSESEKLTWLLLGHGPDDGGGDMALLFSVGSSFLTNGEPFYQRFGLDELSMRSGQLGSTGSILPVDSVVSSQDTGGASDIERRFIVAGKTIASGLRASLEQALSETGTVARLSYRLMRGLRAEITAGTVNGLALVYRWFSMD